MTKLLVNNVIEKRSNLECTTPRKHGIDFPMEIPFSSKTEPEIEMMKISLPIEVKPWKTTGNSKRKSLPGKRLTAFAQKYLIKRYETADNGERGGGEYE